MTNSPLFKRSFVRGLNTHLARTGIVAYPSKEAADLTADFIADNSGMPDPYFEGEKVTLKVAQQLCDNLIQASETVCKEAGGPSEKWAKTAAALTPEDAASVQAWELMEKAAADTGALYEGGEVPNDQPAAAQENAEAALEANRRPENYANLGEDGVGNYERKGEGSVGTEEKHPEAPGATDEGSNSPIENTNKHGVDLASIVEKIKKEAMGSMMEPGQDSNDMPAAAAVNAEAAQEQARRGENYANKGEDGVGRSEMVPGKAEQIGTEQKHPEAPKATDSGKTNVPLEHVKSSAFEELFTETARAVVPYLPENMEETQKVGHVRATMGLDSDGRAQYLENLYTELGAKKEAAEAVRDHFIKAAAEESCSESEKKDEGEKKEEPSLPAFLAKKKEEAPAEEKKEEKAASLSNLKEAISNLNVS